jgi:hypothetical protein
MRPIFRELAIHVSASDPVASIAGLELLVDPHNYCQKYSTMGVPDNVWNQPYDPSQPEPLSASGIDRTLTALLPAMRARR